MGGDCCSLVCRSGGCGGKLSAAGLPAAGCRDRCGGGGFTSRAWASWRWCCWICCCRLVIVRATWGDKRDGFLGCGPERQLLATFGTRLARVLGEPSSRRPKDTRQSTQREPVTWRLTCCSCCLVGPETLRWACSICCWICKRWYACKQRVKTLETVTASGQSQRRASGQSQRRGGRCETAAQITGSQKHFQRGTLSLWNCHIQPF